MLRAFATRRFLVLAIFIGAVVALSLAMRPHLSLDMLVAREADLRDWLARHPWSSLGICFATYTGASLVPGTTGKAIFAGWLLGFWPALVVVNCGLTVAALVSFFVSRYVCCDWVTSHLGPRLARVDAALEREGASYLFAARVLHVPYTVTNYVMGATLIRPVDFWWSTQLGMLPSNIVFVYAGAQAPTVAEIAEEGLASLLSPGLIVAFVVLSIVPLIIRSAVRRWWPAGVRFGRR